MNQTLEFFFQSAQYPFVVVSTLLEKDQEAVIRFLLKLGAPVYLEAISGIREDARLLPLRITCIDALWAHSEACGYRIDGMLRIGGVPTFRPWRDLEEGKKGLSVCSISHLPFSGLSSRGVIDEKLTPFLDHFPLSRSYEPARFEAWQALDRECQARLKELFNEEPLSEPAFIHHLSKRIPEGALLYLGNSQPIREWDMAATYERRRRDVFASRGLNGIDGQLSTFFGLSRPKQSNWGIFGDLTTLYDLAAPWILNQLPDVSVQIVVVNNGGGMIFSRMFPQKEFLNGHDVHFEGVATLWKLPYERWEAPTEFQENGSRIIEILPNSASTKRFWERHAALLSSNKVFKGCGQVINRA